MKEMNIRESAPQVNAQKNNNKTDSKNFRNSDSGEAITVSLVDSTAIDVEWPTRISLENEDFEELNPIIIADNSPEILKKALRDLAMADPRDSEREDTLENPNHCEALSSMADVAKMLNWNVGRNKLYEILRAAAVLNRGNKPYQRCIDSGYFKMKLCCNENLRGYKAVLVTVKGIKFINRVLMNNYIKLSKYE